MSSAAFTTFFISLQILGLLWSIWQSVQLFRSSRPPVTALLYTFALASMLLSDFYWIAYTVIRPETRMPFAVNEIGEWALCLLLAASIASIFRGGTTGAAREMVLAALFAAASAALWIGWSGEWVQDIITGIVCGYFFCTIVEALRTSDILSRREWAALGFLSFVLIILQGLTFVLPQGAGRVVDSCCYVLMFAGIIAFYVKTICEWKRQAQPEALFCLCCATFAWGESCMYMSAEPMYFAAEMAVTVVLPIMTISLRKVVMQDDLC